jgi:hypothetical protein
LPRANPASGEQFHRLRFDTNQDTYWPFVPGRSFKQYGLEQQAEMVADYFMLKRYGMMYPSLLNQSPRPTAEDYEKVVPHAYQPEKGGQ